MHDTTLIAWGWGGGGFLDLALIGLAIIVALGVLIGLTLHWILPCDERPEDLDA